MNGAWIFIEESHRLHSAQRKKIYNSFLAFLLAEISTVGWREMYSTRKYGSRRTTQSGDNEVQKSEKTQDSKKL